MTRHPWVAILALVALITMGAGVRPVPQDLPDWTASVSAPLSVKTGQVNIASNLGTVNPFLTGSGTIRLVHIDLAYSIGNNLIYTAPADTARVLFTYNPVAGDIGGSGLVTLGLAPGQPSDHWDNQQGILIKSVSNSYMSVSAFSSVATNNQGYAFSVYFYVVSGTVS